MLLRCSVVDLSNNRIVDFDGYNLPRYSKVQELNLSGNCLSEINAKTFMWLPLTHLDVSRNRIQEIEGALSLHRNLIFFDLADNRITEINPHGFDTLDRLLKHLKLGGNSIKVLHKGCFRYLKKLTKLELDRNQLTEISSDMWLGLDALVTLILSDNKITTIHNKTFGALPRITRLFLDGNLLTTFLEDAFEPRTSLPLMGIHDIFRGRSELSCSYSPYLISINKFKIF